MSTTGALLVGLPLAIAVLAVPLCWLFFQGARGQRLSAYRSKQPGVNDLLNYASIVDDGIIACKSGALMAAWIYTGDDLANATDEERSRTAAIINQALGPLGNGWMLHVDAVRHATPAYIPKGQSHFPDRISAAIDQERRRFFEGRETMYDGYYVLTVTWLPPLLVTQKLTDLMFDDDSGPLSEEGYYSKILQQFKREVATLESRLSSVFHIARLKSRAGNGTMYDDFLAHLQFCVSGIAQPVQLPPFPVHLDAVLGGQDLWSGVIPKIGRKFVQVVSIEGFPLASVPGILSALGDLDIEYRWSSRFIFLDQQEALREMQKYHRKWKQKQRGIIDALLQTSRPPDRDALDMTNDVDEAIREVKGGLVAYGYYSSCVVIADEDRDKLADAARKTEKLLFNLGFAARIEDNNTMEAWLGSLPGHGEENIRRPLINTLNLAHLLPTSSIWTGEDRCPCPFYPPNSPALMYCTTTGSSVFRLNLHVRDLGHTIIFGPTGSGKSTLLATLVAQYRRYPGMTIFVFDNGLSMYALTSAVGGNHYLIEPNGGLNFCPLQNLETAGDLAWAQDWVEAVLGVNGIKVTPAQRNEIGSALQSMQRSGLTSLTDFSAQVQDEYIRQTFKPYTVDGGMGELLDAQTDGLQIDTRSPALLTFELRSLVNMGEKWALPVLLYLFRRIEKSLRGQPALIVLDEAWRLLGHEVFREKIREWLKVLRKGNCALIMATQSISDAIQSSIFDVIIESTASKIFLPNAQARSETSLETYRRMGLNSSQIDIIASAIPKSDYYLFSEKGSRLFNLALGPLTLAFVGASDAETVEHIQQLENEHGSGWPEIWLKERGIEEDLHVDFHQ